jgi:hypothetical protein
VPQVASDAGELRTALEQAFTGQLPACAAMCSTSKAICVPMW